MECDAAPEVISLLTNFVNKRTRPLLVFNHLGQSLEAGWKDSAKPDFD